MSHHIGKVKKRMVETLLPFQCNHVEGLWKNINKKKIIQKLKERKWRRTKEREGEKEGGEIATKDEA